MDGEPVPVEKMMQDLRLSIRSGGGRGKMDGIPVPVDKMMQDLRLSNIRSGGGSGGFTSSLSRTHPSLMKRPYDQYRMQKDKANRLSQKSLESKPRYIPVYDPIMEYQLHDGYEEGGGYNLINSSGYRFMVYPPANLRPGVKYHPDYVRTPGNKFFPSQDVVEPSTEVKEELQRRREIAKSYGRSLDFSKESEEDIPVPVPKADPSKAKNHKPLNRRQV
jgi:hypothetical protein